MPSSTHCVVASRTHCVVVCRSLCPKRHRQSDRLSRYRIVWFLSADNRYDGSVCSRGGEVWFPNRRPKGKMRVHDVLRSDSDSRRGWFAFLGSWSERQRRCFGLMSILYLVLCQRRRIGSEGRDGRKVESRLNRVADARARSSEAGRVTNWFR